MRPLPLSAPAITLSWLVRLRWIAVIGQLATIAATSLLLRVDLPLVPLALLVAATAVVNVGLSRWLASERAVAPSLLASVLTIDTLTLSGLLYFTGGPSNPFSVLYLVHVTIAALVLGGRWAAALVATSAACYALLFFVNVPIPMLGHMHHGAFGAHLQGMWIGFAITATLIAYFVSRVAAALRERDARLAEAARNVAQHERLVSLTTLAAGAAHELGSPLGTIAVASKELEHALERLPDGERLVEDARLIRAEVARCRNIVQEMSGRAGEAMGEVPEPTDLGTIVASLRASLGPRAARVVVDVWCPSALLVAPRRALVQVLANLVKNALEAGDGAVVLRAEQAGYAVRFVVRDSGPGMAGEVLRRVGEPFFTTKEPGEGMGLGVFLAQTFATRCRGRLELASALGRGTEVVLELPQAGMEQGHAS